ncbi:UPF0182 family protein [Clostridium sp. YIM B02515]|uniref:UPF0182 protein JK636_18200 n=1 Tax=Clostridium rhizosphaerae TaxID=2803861 RepID=A0ABS1TE49_9CLOT|nr:UPF0182 family protein [Clostridium rhizosphaerae]MBL4937648.1 UPF0182 family protein [Clostridium rhizosphaerae]
MKKKYFGITTLFIIILAVIFFDRIINFVVNIKWYGEVGYLSVYFTKILAIVKLMVPIFIIMYVGIWLYYRSLRASIMRLANVLEVSSKSRALERKIFVLANTVISLFISFGIASSYWYRILQFANSTNFGTKDPIFNKDVSFFVFKLPLIESLYSAVMILLVLLIIITLVSYFALSTRDKFFNGDFRGNVIRMKGIRSGITKFAGKQLAVVSALISLMIALGYFIKAWNIVYSPRGVAFGASYTDMHVSLPFYRVISVAAVAAAVIIFISVLRSKAKPIIVSIIAIVVLMVGEGLVSVVIENFLVKSNQISLEKPYIENNINYTRKAFNIDNIQEKPFEVVNNLTKDDIKSNKDTIDNIKINSFTPALEFYNQVQVIRYYYSFNDIDVDRYNMNGKYNQVFVAPREIDLSKLEGNATTWQNKHLIYTHGYGVVMSKVNSVTSEGQPDFVIKDIPPDNSTNIELKNPRIYFGEKTNDYAIGNTDTSEFDYPKGGDNQVNKYDGKAGIKMSFLNRVLFAINERNINFLLSKDISGESKILINRNIKDRVEKIAPFLSYDSDPYMVISGGKLYWIIDAFTTSDRYPYSQPYNNINYIRNSVKVVIDAYDGDTNFYIVDKNDPVAASYAKIFPSLFKDASTLSQDIRDHFRYPEDLFNVQCNVLGKYHMTDPTVFYNGEDLWQIAETQKKVGEQKQNNEGAYMITRLPGNQSEEMVLLEYFNMKSKDNMVALFGARMDKENYGKMVLYKFPPQKTIYSPYLFKQKINQDPSISKEISLWNKEGSEVIYGDTMIVPIKSSLLYVEPIYIRATGKNSIPEMKRIVVGYDDKLLLSDSIENALEQIFNYTAEQQQTPNAPSVPSNVDANMKEKIKSAKEAFDKAVEAQKNGDWAKYGEYIKNLQDILGELNK